MAVLEIINQEKAFTNILLGEAKIDLKELFEIIPDITNGKVVRDVLTEYLPTLIGTYGQVVATEAAKNYELIRAEVNASGRYSSLVAPTPDELRILTGINYRVEPIFRGLESRPDIAFNDIEKMLDRYIRESGRATMDLNVHKDKAALGYARVPSRSNCCSFCALLASRGPVYGAKNATETKNGRRYHDLCGCSAVPFFDLEQEVPGYDPEQFLQRYQETL